MRTIFALLLLAVARADAQSLLRSHGGCCAYGWAVADIGDLDGDGRRDFLVAANSSGQVYAHSSARVEALWVATLAGSDLGYAISAAGDVDGDGIEDVIAGAPTRGGLGVVHLRSGRDGALLREIAAPAGASRFGAAVSSIGDIDADGRSDLLVGAPGSGRVLLLSGASGGEIASVEQAGGEFGAGVAGTDDLDGDGVRDFIVGAPSLQGGRAFVYSGRTRALLLTLAPEAGGGRYGEFFVAGAGDVDGDGLGDLYVGAYAESGNRGAAYVYSGRDGARLHRFLGDAGEGLGPGRGAGDVNADGRADLIVGGYTWSGGGRTEGGRVRIFSGADGSVLASANGSRVRGQLGFDAVGLGDVSGDGRLDFIVASAPANAVDLYAGAIDRAAPFAVGDGLGGAWRDPATEGQGLFLESHTGLDVISGAWFTHSRLPPDAGSGLRWLSFAGRIEGAGGELQLVLTRGGVFDTPGPVENHVVGTLSLQFRDCTHADARYVVRENAISGQGDPASGALRSGRMALTRITPDARCGTPTTR